MKVWSVFLTSNIPILIIFCSGRWSVSIACQMDMYYSVAVVAEWVPPPLSCFQLVFTCKTSTETGIILWQNAFFLRLSANLQYVTKSASKITFKINLYPLFLPNFQFGHWTESLSVAQVYCLLVGLKDKRHMKTIWHNPL